MKSCHRRLSTTSNPIDTANRRIEVQILLVSIPRRKAFTIVPCRSPTLLVVNNIAFESWKLRTVPCKRAVNLRTERPSADLSYCARDPHGQDIVRVYLIERHALKRRRRLPFGPIAMMTQLGHVTDHRARIAPPWIEVAFLEYVVSAAIASVRRMQYSECHPPLFQFVRDYF